MRIAIANWSSRLVGGVEHYISAILETLLDRGHELAFWRQTHGPENRNVIPAAVRIPIWDSSELGLDRSLAALRRWQPDIIYCQLIPDPATEAKILEVAPSVFFAHDYHGTCISGGKATHFPVLQPCTRRFGPACLGHFYLRRCGGKNPITMVQDYRLNVQRLRLLTRYNQVITHSIHLAEEYKKHGIPCGRVRFFASGSKLQEGFTAPPWTPRPRWHFLMLGRMLATKGGSLFLNSLPRIANQTSRPIAVTIAGDGPSRARWESKAKRVERQCSNVEIKFPGWLSGIEREDALSDADLLVLPSVWPEPFGMVGLEAGLRGVPAAGFRVGGIPDWLNDGVNGALAPANPPSPEGLADAILRCISTESAYRTLRDAAFGMAKSVNVQLHCDDLVDVFERVLAKSATVSAT